MKVSELRNEKQGFDQRDMNLKALVVCVCVLLTCLILIVFLLKPFFSFKKKEHIITHSALGVISENFDVNNKFPVPRLEVSPQADLKKFRNWEDSVLNEYGWDDEAQKLVRVPVTEGMKRFLQKEFGEVRAQLRGVITGNDIICHELSAKPTNITSFITHTKNKRLVTEPSFGEGESR